VAGGQRRRKSPFASKSAALEHYRQVIEPQLRGEAPIVPELTLAEFVEVSRQSPPQDQDVDPARSPGVRCRWTPQRVSRRARGGALDQPAPADPVANRHLRTLIAGPAEPQRSLGCAVVDGRPHETVRLSRYQGEHGICGRVRKSRLAAT
jgi:hypothetical protein